MGNLSGTWIQGTGAYEIKQASADDGVIKKGDFWMECTVDGTVSLQSTRAYGEWEFDIYKGDIAGNYFVSIINTITAWASGFGYYIWILSGGDIKFYKRTGGGATSLASTDILYIDNFVWYRLKITRTLDGEFYFYIKGGAFGNDGWTLIAMNSSANPLTDNSYTESQYMSFDFDTNDRIANIITRKAVQK